MKKEDKELRGKFFLAGFIIGYWIMTYKIIEKQNQDPQNLRMEKIILHPDFQKCEICLEEIHPKLNGQDHALECENYPVEELRWNSERFWL